MKKIYLAPAVIILSFLVMNTSSLAALDLVKKYPLTVEIGSAAGSVVSYPAGIDCTISDSVYSGTCSSNFATGSVVVLLAEPPAVLPEGYSTIQPCGWNDSADPDQIAALAVTMDSGKTIKANFCALGIPVMALPLPDSTNMYPPYVPVPEPVISDEAHMKPIAIEQLFDGSIEISIGLPAYIDAGGTQGVDVYVGFNVPGYPDYYQSVWKADIRRQIDDEIFLTIPAVWLPLLPGGAYYFSLMVTPAGETDAWSLWNTYFILNHWMINPFFTP